MAKLNICPAVTAWAGGGGGQEGAGPARAAVNQHLGLPRVFKAVFPLGCRYSTDTLMAALLLPLLLAPLSHQLPWTYQGKKTKTGAALGLLLLRSIPPLLCFCPLVRHHRAANLFHFIDASVSGK